MSTRNTFYNDFDREALTDSNRPDDYRTPFQIDRDRILYTAAFRRLQNKTQVFLSSEYDFYRTRLTHSLEVAQIGRSICAALKDRSALLGDDYFIDPDLVEAACLSHDIGHPPFGHAGERTLHALMLPYGGFEGNGQTLRLLTQTIYGKFGMNPTRAFIDGTLKYKTLLGETPDAPNHFVYDSQKSVLRFVQGDQDYPAELTPGKTRNGFRSIECLIMDWSDDAAYSLNDIIDGVHAGFINIERLERWAKNATLSAAQAAHVDGLLQAIRDDRLESRLGRKIGDFIGAAEIVERPENFMSSLTNRYRYTLTVDPALREESGIYKSIAFDLVFRSPTLQQLDHKADHLLRGLFGVLEKAYITTDKPGRSHMRLVPEATEKAVWEQESTEARARIICDHIAAMTDRFAVRVYKRLFDPDFGSIVDLI